MELPAERVLDEGEGGNFGVDHGGSEGHGEEELQLIPSHHNNLILKSAYTPIIISVLHESRFLSLFTGNGLPLHELAQTRRFKLFLLFQ